MRQERMYGMATFVYHSGHNRHVAGGVHEYERCTAFGKWHIVSAGCFADAAIQIKVFEFVHLYQAFGKEWIELMEAGDGFLQQVFTICERTKRLKTLWFCFSIPGSDRGDA